MNWLKKIFKKPSTLPTGEEKRWGLCCSSCQEDCRKLIEIEGFPKGLCEMCVFKLERGYRSCEFCGKIFNFSGDTFYGVCRKCNIKIYEKIDKEDYFIAEKKCIVENCKCFFHKEKTR